LALLSTLGAFFLPCLSLIKLEKYNYGKWSQLLKQGYLFYIFLW
jgi:hypothetical protein